MASWLHKGKYSNCHNIVKGHAGNDHERRHSYISIKILDNGHSKDGSTAAVGGLYKFSLNIPGLQKKRKPDGNGNAAKSGRKAEGYHFGIPHLVEIRFCYA